MKALLTAGLSCLLITSSAVAQSYQQDTLRYQQDRAAYDEQVRDYDAARAQYDTDKRRYDRRYGAGAYERLHGGFAYERPAPYRSDRYAANDPYMRYANSPCEQIHSQARQNTNAGAAIGALAGAALGAGVNNGNDTGAAILGAVVGGVLGANIAHNSGEAARLAARCDASGYYFSYDQTFPYRATSYNGPNGVYGDRYYIDQRCRLAVAPAYHDGRDDMRYVRVCPDRQSRYRITS